MAELLLELFCEEIPARMQERAAENLKRMVCDGIEGARLSYHSAEAYVTPRRLALVVDGLPAEQPDVTEERKGPQVGAPDKAVQGFKNSLPAGAVIEERDTPKGISYVAVIEIRGRPLVDVFTEIIYRTVWNFPWPKSMRWGALGLRWVRPLHGILLVFNGKLLSTDIPLLHPKDERGEGGLGQGLKTSDRTVGHRFMAPEPFTVENFADYEKKLRAAYVILDPVERKRAIREQAARAAEAEGLEFEPDEALIAENAGMVEWPVALLGRFDESFMDLPPEVLTSAMRSHQKYFPLHKADGSLANRFIVVANIEARDGGRQVLAGNERVLEARLADAKFFWDRDRKRTLASRTPALAGIVFYESLGSLDAKVDRVQALATEIARFIPGASRDRVRSAARLSKADLTTEMVGEFPELQGVMGRYYALNDGEHPAVAAAIAEHYAPQGPSDDCPAAPVSVAVALADKIDTLVGFFAIGERPTGSKDPFALRRAGLGVIRLIVENRLRIPLLALFVDALRNFEPIASGASKRAKRLRACLQHPDGLAQQLLDFLEDRLKVHLKERGVRHDLIGAVFAARGAGGRREDDLLRVLARVDALERFLESEAGRHLLIAYKRASNIVRIEEKNDGVTYDGAFREKLLVQPEERALHERLAGLNEAAVPALEKEDFGAAMAAVARLREPVDDFFDKVTVNCEEPELRANRLRLLSQIRSALGGIADFSKIEG